MHNIILQVPQHVEAYRRDLGAYLDEARIYRSWKEGEVVIENESIRDRLRALGYLQ